ncbi:8362_t:CDS:2 [Diversispora eburnea]|uniref:8362_t:CDS:1 n=1 Tax=Diversispora eburnea TaxID=1213867 RepID=A0A9N9B8R9_9GLOM|nr:8362_t:CDS:2 [Diversispora eburnea]
MKNIGTKQVLRIDPSIKRNLCRKCDTLLLPGITSQVRMKFRCVECNATKKFVARKGHILFSEKPENIFGMDNVVENNDNSNNSNNINNNVDNVERNANIENQVD